MLLHSQCYVVAALAVSGQLLNPSKRMYCLLSARARPPHLEELCSKLVGQQRNVLQDCQPHTPVLVLCQLLNGWQQALSQQLNANDLVHLHSRAMTAAATRWSRGRMHEKQVAVCFVAWRALPEGSACATRLVHVPGLNSAKAVLQLKPMKPWNRPSAAVQGAWALAVWHLVIHGVQHTLIPDPVC